MHKQDALLALTCNGTTIFGKASGLAGSGQAASTFFCMLVVKLGQTFQKLVSMN